MVAVTFVKVEHRRSDDLLGLGQAAPRLSWVSETDVPFEYAATAVAPSALRR